MDPTPHALAPGEIDRLLLAEGAGFGYVPNDAQLAEQRDHAAEWRCFGIDEGVQLVATGANQPMALTVPGGALLPMAGVTAISTRPTHRRRGLITAMLHTLLDDAEAHGEPIAGLWASESVIYPRFGFGLAVENESWEIDRTYAALASSPDVPGTLRMADSVADARTASEQVWEHTYRTRPGMTARNSQMWDHRFDPRRERPVQFAVLYEVGGACEGYALYSIRAESVDGHAQNEVTVHELIAATDAAYAALWGYVTSLDLTKTVRAANRPVDDPLPWMLADPRRLSRRRRDAIWLRLIDVPRALEARTYRTAGSLVIEVTDAFRPQSGGRFRLDASAAGAACARTGDAAAIALSTADLAAIYLGGTSFQALQRAGRVHECVPGALTWADAMFATERAPWCPQHW